MGEQKIIKKNMIKNIAINFIVFFIMFLIFDFMIYNQVSNSLYHTIDEELTHAKQRQEQREGKGNGIIITDNNINNINDINNANDDDTNIDTNNTVSSNGELIIEKQEQRNRPLDIEKTLNPRIITIIRNEDGEIINSSNIGSIYEEYGEEIVFNKNSLDVIYSMQLNNQYAYRAINFKMTQSDGQEVYVQLLANVDGEKQTLDNLTNVMIGGTSLLLALALAASYLLAKRVIKPILENYRKQTEFVQNASHELRTPITIIQGQQELLLKQPNCKIIEKSEYINQTLKETKRMTRLLKELMDLARADNHETIKIDNRELDINELIKEIIPPYEEYAKSQEKTIELELNCNKKIKADRNKLSELLIILLDNAIKYTNPKDKITIKTEKKDGKMNLEISDTGIGISKEALPHVFERFYRGDASHSKEIEGSGLGLSIAQTIVDMHHGTIKIVANEPKGTKVKVRI